MNPRISIFLLLCIPFLGLAQHSSQEKSHPAEGVEVHHEDFKPFRVALLLGHTLIPEEHAGENFFIPSWGLDIEYWFNSYIGAGLHNDIELETYVVLGTGGESEDLERVSPLVATVDLLIRPWKGLVLQVGPGIEFEKGENFGLMRFGVEYEVEIGDHWDLCPTIFYDTRFSQYNTWSLALGVAKRF